MLCGFVDSKVGSGKSVILEANDTVLQWADKLWRVRLAAINKELSVATAATWKEQPNTNTHCFHTN
jgi:hypothetical protein